MALSTCNFSILSIKYLKISKKPKIWRILLCLYTYKAIKILRLFCFQHFLLLQSFVNKINILKNNKKLLKACVWENVQVKLRQNAIWNRFGGVNIMYAIALNLIPYLFNYLHKTFIWLSAKSAWRNNQVSKMHLAWIQTEGELGRILILRFVLLFHC